VFQQQSPFASPAQRKLADKLLVSGALAGRSLDMAKKLPIRHTSKDSGLAVKVLLPTLARENHAKQLPGRPVPYVTEEISPQEKIHFRACIFTAQVYKIESQRRLRGFAEGQVGGPFKED
jgi:hypothetical protein